MNKTLQEQIIRKKIKSLGYDTDLIDVSALIDSTLHIEENWRIIKEDIPLMDLTRTNRKKSVNYVLQALEFNKTRSARSQFKDSSIQARKTFDSANLTKKQFLKWKKYPYKYDIIGVDSKHGSLY